MKSYYLQTPRCRLREMNSDDCKNIFKLNQHPDIYKFTTDPPFDTVEDARIFLQNYDAYSRTGLGRMAVELKDTGEFIGWCGLKYILDENEVDIGYRFLPEFWGKGYAVETAKACCEKGIAELGLTRIVARIHKANQRSIRVAEKMKMIYERDLMYDDVPWSNYIYPFDEGIKNKKTERSIYF